MTPKICESVSKILLINHRCRYPTSVNCSGLQRSAASTHELLSAISRCFDPMGGATICFTICVFISLDLDGYRAPKRHLALQGPHDMFSR